MVLTGTTRQRKKYLTPPAWQSSHQPSIIPNYHIFNHARTQTVWARPVWNLFFPNIKCKFYVLLRKNELEFSHLETTEDTEIIRTLSPRQTSGLTASTTVKKSWKYFWNIRLNLFLFEFFTLRTKQTSTHLTKSTQFLLDYDYDEEIEDVSTDYEVLNNIVISTTPDVTHLGKNFVDETQLQKPEVAENISMQNFNGKK